MPELVDKIRDMVGNFVRGKMTDAEVLARDVIKHKTADHVSQETGVEVDSIYKDPTVDEPVIDDKDEE